MAITNNSIDLFWDAATDNVGVTDYKVYKSTDNITYDSGISVGNVLLYTYPGLDPDTNYWFKNTALDLAGNESNFSNIVMDRTLEAGPVIEHLLFLQNGTDDDRLTVDPGSEIDLLHTVNWSVTVWHRYPLVPTGNNAIMESNISIIFLRRMSNGEMRASVTTGDMRWNAAGVIATNDTLEHKYELYWEVGDNALSLKIDDVDYGPANITPQVPTETDYVLGYDPAISDAEIRRMIIVSEGVTHTFPINEGSGIVVTSDTGKIFIITTQNPGGLTWINGTIWTIV